jgi:hypothetical protein
VEAGQLFGAIVRAVIARHASASGTDAEIVARELASGIAGDGLRFVVVFADWRIDPTTLARDLQRALSPAPVVGCTTVGVIGGPAPPADGVPYSGSTTARAVGLYGDWLRVGVGVAPELPKSALARGRDAVSHAASALGTTASALDPSRHIAFTLVDGTSGHEEAFCIGSAAAAPQIRVVGGSAATEVGSSRKAFVWAMGEAVADAAVVVVLDSELPFEPVTSSHLRRTEAKTVITAASGRTIDELDGRPAAERLRALVSELGEQLDEQRPWSYTFARFIGGTPYVRSMTGISGSRIQLASAVEVGHVLHVMRPGDLIGKTRRDLATAAARVGGEVAALLAFSCIGRHWEAAARGQEHALDAVYAAYPTAGFQSYGEQTGMLLVNHTLTGLAIGAR